MAPYFLSGWLTGDLEKGQEVEWEDEERKEEEAGEGEVKRREKLSVEGRMIKVEGGQKSREEEKKRRREDVKC